jgi:RNA polymerase sigma-B factor
MSHQCSEPYEDLEQVGYLGLIRAIERFDPSQGCAFSSFAVPYVRGEMLHFLRDRSTTVKIPRRWQELQKTARTAKAELLKHLHRQPTDEELVQRLGISLAEWQEIQLAYSNRSPLSLDAMISQQQDSDLTLGETLLDEHFQSQRIWEEDRQQLQGALVHLEEKTRLVIEFVFIQGLSRKEVADRIGVSPMTISRWIQRGIEQLIQTLQPQVA